MRMTTNDSSLLPKQYHTPLEINNSSLRPTASRQGAKKTLPILLSFCKRYQVPVVLGSDAHIWYDVGDLSHAQALLNFLDFPETLILNSRADGLDAILKKSII